MPPPIIAPGSVTSPIMASTRHVMQEHSDDIASPLEYVPTELQVDSRGPVPAHTFPRHIENPKQHTAMRNSPDIGGVIMDAIALIFVSP